MLVIAVSKYFVVNMLKSLNTEINETMTVSLKYYLEDRYLLANVTNIFSILLIGNLMDNVTDHKALVTVCNLALTICYLLYGALIIFDNHSEYMNEN